MDPHLGGGVAKFDGQNWTVLNTQNSGLPHNDMGLNILVDKDNQKWIPTWGGVSEI